MNLTGTHINYYHICHRKLWLFANGLQMEQRSSLVAEGRFIHETSYGQRAKKYKELALDGIKLDHYDAKNKIVREVKKSNKKELAHVAQVQYYLWVLEQNGIEATGVLEYPKLRLVEAVPYDETTRDLVKKWVEATQAILEQENCPPTIDKKWCRRCAYYEFCYTDEL